MIIRISEAKDNVDQEVTIQGWMFNKRGSGKIYFLQLRDGSGFMQGVVTEDSSSKEIMDIAESLTAESSVKVAGQISAHPKHEDVFELQVSNIEIITLCTEEYPISKKEHGPDFLLNNRHLWVRSKKQWAALRIRDEITWRTQEFLRMKDFVRTDTPIFQPTSCEDTTELYEVDHFGEPAYLTQSGQLYIEALEHSLGRVYDFGPVFRAEKSKTRKHLNEFWMMDWEAVFFDQQMSEDFTEELVKYVLRAVLENKQVELKILDRDTTLLERAVNEPFVRIKLSEIIKILNKEHGFELGPEDDLNTEAEEKIGEIYGVPVFVEDYPFAVKAFYMKRYTDEDGVERGYGCDLIVPEGGGELATAAVRENSYDNLLNSLNERGYPVEDYQWYLDVRKYGGVPHAGGGVGLERWVRWVTGASHIRETIPFPRMIGRLRP